jgi:hypothetical protein
MQPGVAGAIMAPTYRLFQRVVLPTWRALVPSQLYRYRPGDQCIDLVNGTRIFCLGTNRAIERVIGLNLGWAAMDEAGVARDDEVARMIMQRIRIGDPRHRALALFTSPHGFGWLKDWSEQRDLNGRDAVDVVRATTYQNPHLPIEYIADLEVEFPPGTMIHRQELLGEFVVATGLVYDMFSRVAHITPAFDNFDAPYALGWDPGSRASGVLAFQRQAGAHVAVRQWTPSDRFTDDVARDVLRDMGRSPRAVYLDTPSKLNTRTGITDVEAIQAVFPRAKIQVLGGRRRSSEYRHRAVSSALRRHELVFSDSLLPGRISLDERGLIHALESLAWSDTSTRKERVDDSDPLKHIIDALEFYVSAVLPPRYSDPQTHINARAA